MEDEGNLTVQNPSGRQPLSKVVEITEKEKEHPTYVPYLYFGTLLIIVCALHYTCVVQAADPNWFWSHMNGRLLMHPSIHIGFWFCAFNGSAA